MYTSWYLISVGSEKPNPRLKIGIFWNEKSKIILYK